jgi:hypothetical protein
MSGVRHNAKPRGTHDTRQTLRNQSARPRCVLAAQDQRRHGQLPIGRQRRSFAQQGLKVERPFGEPAT